MFAHIGRYIALVVLCAAAGFGGAFLNTGHTGAPGARGPAGITGKAGQSPSLPTILKYVKVNTYYGDLGVCVYATDDSSTGDVDQIFVESPSLSNSVESCQYGNFVAVVPGYSTDAGDPNAFAS